jgi:hypothetical protein
VSKANLRLYVVTSFVHLLYVNSYIRNIRICEDRETDEPGSVRIYIKLDESNCQTGHSTGSGKVSVEERTTPLEKIRKCKKYENIHRRTRAGISRAGVPWKQATLVRSKLLQAARNSIVVA